MIIKKVRLPECHTIEGLAVVIDVIRAFTTAAHAFASGAEKMILMGDVEEAKQLHASLPGTLLAGEVQGSPIEGFHFGNSPVEMSQAALQGRTLIFRTSSGTQGVVRSTKASHILASSFAVAEATLNRIKQLKTDQVTFVITGTTQGGFEDLALADYLEERLLGNRVDPAPFLERVRQSPTGIKFATSGLPQFPPHDLEASCELDKFPFALEVTREEGLHILRKVD